MNRAAHRSRGIKRPRITCIMQRDLESIGYSGLPHLTWGIVLASSSVSAKCRREILWSLQNLFCSLLLSSTGAVEICNQCPLDAWLLNSPSSSFFFPLSSSPEVRRSILYFFSYFPKVFSKRDKSSVCTYILPGKKTGRKETNFKRKLHVHTCT